MQINYPRSEEAYLCGMFRGLGELLVACYVQKQHGEILEVMGRESLSEREACRRVLSFTYEDLGRGMCRQWNLPKKVANCMDKLPSFAATAESELLHKCNDLLATFRRVLTVDRVR